MYIVQAETRQPQNGPKRTEWYSIDKEIRELESRIGTVEDAEHNNLNAALVKEQSAMNSKKLESSNLLNAIEWGERDVGRGWAILGQEARSEG